MSQSTLKSTLISSVFCLVAGSLNAQLVFEIPSNSSISDLDSFEYFFNTDPGMGNGHMSFLENASVISDVFSINIAGIHPGVHQFYIRVKDTDGNWSLLKKQAIMVTDTSLNFPAPNKNIITGVEYFINTDPGYGSAVYVPTTMDTLYSNSLPIHISELTHGIYNFSIRAKDIFNNWSMTTTATWAVLDNSFNIPMQHDLDSIHFLEYFIDTDPGLGNGYIVAVPSGTEVNSFNFPVHLSAIPDGLHSLFIRIISNDVSVTQARSFSIGEPLSISLWLAFDIQHSQHEVQLKWVVSDDEDQKEYRIEKSYNGLDFHEIGTTISQRKQNITYHFSDKNVKSDLIYYRIKAISDIGNETYSMVNKVTAAQIGYSFSVTNPNKEYLTIFNKKHTNRDSMSYQIINMNGSILMSGSLSSSDEQLLNISGLSSGNYFIKIYSMEVLEIFKFIKQ